MRSRTVSMPTACWAASPCSQRPGSWPSTTPSENQRSLLMTRLAMLMDPLGSINIEKDSSFAMLLAAQRRGWELLYLEQSDLILRDGRVYAHLRRLHVRDDPEDWYELEGAHTEPLEQVDILLMRKD